MPTIVIDRREAGRTEIDTRGKFLAPDVSVLVTSVLQADGSVRRIYAHTRHDARRLRDWVRDEPAIIDGLPRDQIALVTE